MRSHSGSGSYESEQAMRNVWLVRGLRAVAAALVVGGIVLAAFDHDRLQAGSRRRARRGIAAAATADDRDFKIVVRCHT